VSSHIAWSRVLVEAAVIVSSILLAFAIDAWWDDAQLAEEVAQDLGNVAQELEVNLELLRFNLDVTERMVAGGSGMLEAMERESPSEALSLPDTLVWLGTSTGPSLNASLGALEALIASGRLAAVDDPFVRLKLAGLPSRFADILEVQNRVIAVSMTQIRPLSYDRVDNRLDLAVADGFWNEDLTVGRPLPHRGTVTFPNNQSLRNWIRIRRTNLTNVIPKMASVQADLEELLQYLR
jgi:hypothetical protein